MKDSGVPALRAGQAQLPESTQGTAATSFLAPCFVCGGSGEIDDPRDGGRHPNDPANGKVRCDQCGGTGLDEVESTAADEDFTAVAP